MDNNPNALLGLDTDASGFVIKNRKYRRRRRFAAELDGLPKHYYTKKHSTRRKNGKKAKKHKK